MVTYSIAMAIPRNITMWDLNVGKEVCVYGKVVRPVACDSFTRHFLTCQVAALHHSSMYSCTFYSIRQGVEVGAEEPVPGDTHHHHRDKLEARWAG